MPRFSRNARVVPGGTADKRLARVPSMAPIPSATSKNSSDTSDAPDRMDSDASHSRRSLSKVVAARARRAASAMWPSLGKTARGPDSPVSVAFGVEEMAAVAAELGWHLADASASHTWAVPEHASLVVVAMTTGNAGMGFACIQLMRAQPERVTVPIIGLLSDALLGGDLSQALAIHCELQACGGDDVVHGVESRAALEWAIAMCRVRCSPRRCTPRSDSIADSLVLSESLILSDASWARRLTPHKSFAECGVNTDVAAAAQDRRARSWSPCARFGSDAGSGDEGYGLSARPPLAPGILDHLRAEACRAWCASRRRSPSPRGERRARGDSSDDAQSSRPIGSGEELDGIWVSRYVTDSTGHALPGALVSSWLRTLDIRGDKVRCATGEILTMKNQEGKKFLDGGELLMDKELLKRVGKSGAVVVFGRCVDGGGACQ